MINIFNYNILCFLSYTKNTKTNAYKLFNSSGLENINTIFSALTIEEGMDIELEFNKISKNKSLCAMIIQLEPLGLNNSSYLKCIKKSINLIATKEDFRLFVIDNNGLLSENTSFLQQHESYDIIQDLKDSVQILLYKNELKIYQEIFDYINSLPIIRKGIRLKKLLLSISIISGKISSFFQVFCFAIFIFCLIMTLFNMFNPLFMYDIEPSVLGLVSGVILFPILSVMFYNIMSGQNHKLLNWSKKKLYFFTLNLSYICCGGVVLLLTINHSLNKYFMFGCLLGTFLDSIRRNYYRDSQSLLSINEKLLTPKQKELSISLQDVVNGVPPNPLNCPILGIKYSKVFISYSRSSNWANNLANKLYKELTNNGTICFLDQVSISTGINWRKSINNRLFDANIIISLVDNTSVKKMWPAVELEFSLISKLKIGIPEIIVISEKKAATYTKYENKYPVFQSILNSKHSKNIYSPRVLQYNETLISRIAFELSPERYQDLSIIPSQLSFFIHPLIKYFVLIGMLGLYIGPIFGVISLLCLFININDTNINFNFFYYFYMLLAYWLGFTVRIYLFSRYELTYKQFKNIDFVQLFSIFCYILIIIFYLPKLDVLFLGYMILFNIFGIMIGSKCVHYSSLGDKKIKHSTT